MLTDLVSAQTPGSQADVSSLCPHVVGRQETSPGTNVIPKAASLGPICPLSPDITTCRVRISTYEF